MDAISIRLPYRHLKETELELVGLNGDRHGEIDDRNARESTSVPLSSPSGVYSGADDSSPGTSSSESKNPRPDRRLGMKTLVLSCMVGAGVQFGWALQLSLLTPYIQTLGIQHAFSSFIWLCGPITGLIVQPCVGIWSDKCHLKLGRRRPFILAGCIMISFAVTLIGFAADIGHLLGDTDEDCMTYKGPRWRAAAIFILGFWMLDLANNTVQGPARALLADLSGPDQCNSANAIFCSWMALGNILGFSAGASGQWTRWFPFLRTKACCEACANLKAAFLVAVTSWFPFFLFDTDWMGREVYHGDPKGYPSESDAYQNGVREGAFGLLLNSVVLGISSFLIDPMCWRMGSKIVWAMSNFIVFVCMAATTIITFLSISDYSDGIQHVLRANKAIKIAALVIFSLLGFPLAITYSVPFSVTAELTAGTGGGQGLATGVLNLAIVIPQMIVSIGAGPWDALFGGGNIPAFFLASVFSLAGGIIAILKLPALSNYSSSGFHGFG